MSDSTKQLTRATIRVLIVDDHEIVRKGICSMLSEEEDFEVVGQTGSGKLAVTLATDDNQTSFYSTYSLVQVTGWILHNNCNEVAQKHVL